jgi:hypothetical protein
MLGIGPLYDPAPSFMASLLSLLTLMADVRHIPSFENLQFYLREIVPLVKA